MGVYLSFEPFDTNKPESDTTTPAKTPNTTHLEFQHVPVTNVQTTGDPVSQDDENGQCSRCRRPTTSSRWRSRRRESERFVFATEFGHVWLSNEPATVTDDGTEHRHPGQRLHGGAVMDDTIIYAPAALQDEVAERLAGMPVSVKAAPTVTCPRPRP